MENFDIVGVGNATIDYLYLLTNLPSQDESAYILDETTSVGGASSNVVATLDQFGYSTGLVTRLGDDLNGQNIMADLQERGIDCTHVEICPGDTTAFARIYADGGGNNFIIGGGNSAARNRLNADRIQYLRHTTVVHTSGYAPPEILRKLLESGIPDERLFSFDLATVFDELSGRGYIRDDIEAAISAADLFVGNLSSVRSLFGTDDIDAMIANLQQCGLSRGVITMGENGAVLISSDDVIEIRAFDVEVADTTGAGDVFTACLLHAWFFNEMSMRRAGEFAAAGAALCCRSRGAQQKSLTIDAIEKLAEN
jgi:ribokinase/sulfofructose kinase